MASGCRCTERNLDESRQRRPRWCKRCRGRRPPSGRGVGPAGAVIAQRLCAVPSVGETDGTAQFFLMSHSSTVSRVALFFEIVLICDITGSGDIAGGHKTKKE